MAQRESDSLRLYHSVWGFFIWIRDWL
uniref:Uncharacterized protein n=1 Tax=Arundo donax TaxID=35708 RepID=A0A0A9AXM8_ARUDO